ncbi:MAG: hypothetical protein M3R38_22510, partial [Actinomycetota bacterium]|nr:hypothetical protein [Actinomycetota bacterium]
MKPAPPQEREKELPARRSRERAYHKQGGVRLAPRVVRALALVAVAPAVVAATVLAGMRGWVSAVAGERLSPAAKDAATVILFTVVLPVAVSTLVVGRPRHGPR